MQVNKNGTMYDVYVKNDYFYKKAYSDGGGKLDLSIDDYMRKVQDSIPELKDVSIGDISIHILPENENQPLIRVNILPPTGEEKKVIDGIYGKEEVVSGIVDAMGQCSGENSWGENAQGGRFLEG